MYSGRPAYQASCSATRGDSRASSANPMRMRCHRSLSGNGTSSRSSKAGGRAGPGTVAGAAADAKKPGESRARVSAKVLSFRVKCIRLVVVLQGLLDATRHPSQRQGEIPDERPRGSHRTGRALAVGVAVGHEIALPGERLEVLAEDPIGRVVEAHHVELPADGASF